MKVEARLSAGAWFAQVAVFTGMFLADVFSAGTAGTTVELAKAFARVISKPAGGWDCAMKEIALMADGSKPSSEQIVGLMKTALTCVPLLWDNLVEAGVLKTAFSALAAVILNIFTAGIAVIWGALEVSLRNVLDLWRGLGSGTTVTWTVSAKFACPSNQAILSAVTAQRPDLASGSLSVAPGAICAGPWTEALIMDAKAGAGHEGFTVYLKREAGNLVLKGLGSGVYCVSDPSMADGSDAVYIEPQYKRVFDCQ